MGDSKGITVAEMTPAKCSPRRLKIDIPPSKQSLMEGRQQMAEFDECILLLCWHSDTVDIPYPGGAIGFHGRIEFHDYLIL